MNRYCGVVWSI